MKLLATLLVVLALSVGLALLAHQDSGYVLIARGDTTVETSLSLFLLVLVGGVALIYLALRIAARTWGLPRQLRHWRQERHSRRARSASNRGLIALSEGDWATAEKTLIRNVRYTDTPLVNYLSAARAAQKQNAPERRDHYLALAHRSTRGADIAVELTQGELQLAHGQLEQALATLMHLQSIAPKHQHVLYLLMRLYERLKSWGDLERLLPDLRRYEAADEATLDALERRVHRELLALAARSRSTQRLTEVWERVPRALRRDEELVYDYARHLICHQESAKAEAILRDTLKHRWSDRLVNLYGLAEGGEKDKQLAQAEGWLKERQHNPTLLLALGRLSLRNQLWGKARAYLEASLGIEARPETYKELGELLTRLGETEAATECYRKGLDEAADQSICATLEDRDRPTTSLPARRASSDQSLAYSKLSQ